MKKDIDVKCYELTLTPNYVSDWTFNDALRELIQNGTDQEVLDKENKFQIIYNGKEKTLRLVNQKSVLKINTLLLGRSSKANNEDTVGQFGEGYKIAALVLNRLGKTFTIYNNEKGEIWESRFKNSEKWLEKILAFYVYKHDTDNSGLCIEVGNVTHEEFNNLYKVWLHLENCDYIIKRYTKDGYLPFKLQTFEVDELDNSQMLPKKKGNKVVGGIEMNEYNKPMGYWIRQYSVDGMALSNPVYVDAKDVIFLYTKHRPSQVREMSDMSPTITRIRDANEFMIAVSVKERIAACLSVFIKKQLPTTGIGRQNGSVPGPHQDYQGKSIAPGMIKELNAGDEIQVVNPTGQATDAASYIKLQQRLVGAGQGISYEATSRDMSESNYSSTRQGIIEDDMTYAEEKEMLMEVMDEIYETFIISLWLAGELDAKDFWDNKDKYFEHAWITAPKKWIDPQKEANANKIALNTGQKTFKQIAAEQGRDWKEQIDEMAEVLEYAKDKGIDLGGVIFDQTAAELYEDEETPADNPQQTDGNQTGEETGQESEEGDGAEEEGETDNQGTDS